MTPRILCALILDAWALRSRAADDADDHREALGYGANVWDAMAPEVERLHEMEKASDRERKATARENPETWARELEATRERVRKARSIVRHREHPNQLRLFAA